MSSDVGWSEQANGINVYREIERYIPELNGGMGMTDALFVILRHLKEVHEKLEAAVPRVQ